MLENLLEQTFGANSGKETQNKIEERQEFEKHNNVQKIPVNSDYYPSYVNKLQHAVGMTSALEYISHLIGKNADIKFEHNIIYLDSSASSRFLIGRVHPYKDNDGKEVKYNPFLSSYYDFLANILWESVFVYENKIYLLSKQSDLNSLKCKSIPQFTLAIKIDDTDKLERWKNSDKLDIRKVIFDVRQEEYLQDFNGNIVNPEYFDSIDEDNLTDEQIRFLSSITTQTSNIPIQKINELTVEQTVPLLFLNESNKHLIFSANNRKMMAEAEHIADMSNTRSETKMRNYMLGSAQLYDFYHIDINNKAQRKYGNEEKEWAANNHVDEKGMGWSEYRDTADDD